ncbi:hypothetical protein B296_00057546, partial [Ensete ventricosum]
MVLLKPEKERRTRTRSKRSRSGRRSRKKRRKEHIGRTGRRRPAVEMEAAALRVGGSGDAVGRSHGKGRERE